MKIIISKLNVCFLAWAASLVVTSGMCLHGQNSSNAYFALNTAMNTAVFDTITGLNLSVQKINPQAKRGVVEIFMLTAGGSGNPYVYRIRYTPNQNFVGLDTFTLELNHVGGLPYLVYRAYKVQVSPSKITTQPDYFTTPAGVPVTMDVLSNDASTNGPLKIGSIPVVNGGTAIITNNQKIQFTPKPGYTGLGHVHYTVCDALNYCVSQQATIGIYPATKPAGDTISVATKKGKSLSIPLPLSGFSISQPPANGTLQLTGGQQFTYKPYGNFVGNDRFILKNNFYGSVFYKTVFLQVLDAPAENNMAIEDVVFTPPGKSITFNVKANDIGNSQVKNWVTPPALPGTISGTNSNGLVTFTPKPGFTGVATFYYSIGNLFCSDLEFCPVNVVVSNLAPQFSEYNFVTPVGTPFVINYKIPFTNFTFTLVEAPKNGSCTVYPGFSTQVLNGQSVSGYNLVVYKPKNNYTGPDDFKLRYCAPNGQCQLESVKMDVRNIDGSAPPYCISDCVWPGDLNIDGIVNSKDLLALGRALGTPGKIRPNASMEWYGQFSSNWNNPIAGAKNDLKFLDSDGNGLITANDTAAVQGFYNQTNQFTTDYPIIGKGIPFDLQLLNTKKPKVGDKVSILISVGVPGYPALDLYGFNFELQISDNIVDSAYTMSYFPNSWLNYNSPYLTKVQKSGRGRIESAFTRTMGQPISGSGIVAQADFIIIDIVHGGKPEGNDKLLVRLQAPQTMEAGGILQNAEPIALEIPLDLPDDRAETSLSAEKQGFTVVPNPAHEVIHLRATGSGMEEIWVRDAQGKMLAHSDAGGSESWSLSCNNWPAGWYAIQVTTQAGFFVQKLLVQH